MDIHAFMLFIRHLSLADADVYSIKDVVSVILTFLRRFVLASHHQHLQLWASDTLQLAHRHNWRGNRLSVSNLLHRPGRTTNSQDLKVLTLCVLCVCNWCVVVNNGQQWGRRDRACTKGRNTEPGIQGYWSVWGVATGVLRCSHKEQALSEQGWACSISDTHLSSSASAFKINKLTFFCIFHPENIFLHNNYKKNRAELSDIAATLRSIRSTSRQMNNLSSSRYLGIKTNSVLW